MASAPAFSIAAIDCFERPVRYRLPFRFGAATVREGVQAFVRSRIRFGNGRESEGATAELMVPKWFDKDPALSNAANVDQLRSSLAIAARAYADDSASRTAFAHSVVHANAARSEAIRRGLPPLVAAFGPAEIDRAILDALCRALAISFFDAIARNVVGFAPADVATDLPGFDADAFVATLHPSRSIAIRHTIGLADALSGHPHDANDGLPESLAEVIASEQPRWFKIKLCGDPAGDIARLVDIARVLDALSDYRVTLDGNEQFANADALAELLVSIDAEPKLRRLAAAIAFVEQPFSRRATFDVDVHDIARRVPLVIDEADATLDAFPQARARGYSGVSSKSCKGLYKALVNVARCRRWNADERAAPCFVTAEDLTTPAGLALQQDVALAALVGASHCERNGHHYIDGFAGESAPVDEAQAFARAHPDLYSPGGHGVRVAVRDGTLAIGSLDVAGFASAAWPRFDTLAAMHAPASERQRQRIGATNG